MIAIKELTDIDELMRWRKEVIENVFEITPEDNLMASNRHYYEQHITDGTHLAFLANCGGEYAGCGSLCLTDELPSPDNPSGKCAYLMNIYVKEKFRQHGVGHALVNYLLREAKKRECGKIYLETTPLGRGLYESSGFKDLPDMMKYTDDDNKI